MPFIYPTAFEMNEIQPDLMARARAGRLGLDLMPVVDKNVPKVRWVQKDNYFGLQHMRGLDGAPTRVTRPGQKVYEYEPGVFGEYVDITESELTTRAASLPVESTPIDVSDLVMDADEQLINREFDRIESSIWTLITTGTIKILLDGPDGTQYGYSDTYTFQSYTAPVAFSNLATSTPIKAFQSVQQLGFAAGHSVDFGAGAIAVANQVTANTILNNQNANDFAGRRGSAGATINNLTELASYWQAQNLPKLVTYDQGYIPKIGGTFQKFIPDGIIAVIGQRPAGARVGEYLTTRNASNGFRPGSYRYVLDRANGGANGGGYAEKRTPANIEVHRGHNGGPVAYYPSAIVVMHV